MKFKIEPEIFQKWPQVKIGAIVALGVKNTESKAILNLLRQQEKATKQELGDRVISQLPEVAAWRKTYKEFGVSGNKYVSSVEALLKRVSNGGQLSDINPLVNAYNYLSLKYRLPLGGEDLDKVKGDVRLVIASGNEGGKFIGDSEVSFCDNGEVAYVDDLGFICRRWNWREADRIKLDQQTHNVILVIEAMPPVSGEQLKQALIELSDLVQKELTGKISSKILDKDDSEWEIDFASGKKALAEKYQKVKLVKKSVKQQKTKSEAVGLGLVIKKAIEKMVGKDIKFSVEHPENMVWGDYSTNVGIITHKPQEIVAKLKAEPNLKKIASKIEVAGAGFINISIQSKALITQINKLLKGDREKPLKGKTFLLEHTSPNPNKAMHLGHLRNNLTGMALANIFEYQGAKVIKDCIDNNRGIAIAKLMWGYLKFGRKDKKQIEDINYWFDHQTEWQNPQDAKQRPDRFVDELYVKGSEDCQNPETEKKIRQLVIDWEAKDKKNWALWKKVLQYSYKGQVLTLERLGSRWDKVWHEHEHYQQGKDLVKKGLKMGVFKIGKLGAVVTDLKKYGLEDTVVIKAEGTALYITQDLALTKLKKETYNPERLFWVIGPEQSLALKQMFSCCEQLGIIKVKDCNHVAYGYMSLKGKGKMSSRLGTVIYIDDLLDEAKKQIQSSFKCSDELAGKIGVGAVKYSILKVGRLKNIAFDFKESLSFEGNSGPYLQYTYARARSVLEKAKKGPSLSLSDKDGPCQPEEEILLRTLYRFEEVVVEAAEELAPNHLANFLYDLTQKYNAFYNKHRIIGNEFRLWLTHATAEILKKGLWLLGIKAPEKM